MLLRVAAGAARAQAQLTRHNIEDFRPIVTSSLATQSAARDGYCIELAHEEAHRSVLALLIETGITSIRTSRPSLEEVHVHLIGERGLKL